MNISIHNRIQCLMQIHITDITDKLERESIQKNEKWNSPESSETCDDARWRQIVWV